MNHPLCPFEISQIIEDIKNTKHYALKNLHTNRLCQNCCKFHGISHLSPEVASMEPCIHCLECGMNFVLQRYPLKVQHGDFCKYSNVLREIHTQIDIHTISEDKNARFIPTTNLEPNGKMRINTTMGKMTYINKSDYSEDSSWNSTYYYNPHLGGLVREMDTDDAEIQVVPLPERLSAADVEKELHMYECDDSKKSTGNFTDHCRSV